MLFRQLRNNLPLCNYLRFLDISIIVCIYLDNKCDQWNLNNVSVVYACMPLLQLDGSCFQLLQPLRPIPPPVLTPRTTLLHVQRSREPTAGIASTPHDGVPTTQRARPCKPIPQYRFDIFDIVEYIVHGSKNQIDSNFYNLLWSEFFETNATFRSASTDL